MSNGFEFDSNMKNGVKGDALPVVVGSKSVIMGWEEGLKYFSEARSRCLPQAHATDNADRVKARRKEERFRFRMKAFDHLDGMIGERVRGVVTGR
ncbi:MAG: hypothetical protein V9E96_04760 [Chitinophagaceae bacterium]